MSSIPKKIRLVDAMGDHWDYQILKSAMHPGGNHIVGLAKTYQTTIDDVEDDVEDDYGPYYTVLVFRIIEGIGGRQILDTSEVGTYDLSFSKKNSMIDFDKILRCKETNPFIRTDEDGQRYHALEWLPSV